MKRVPLSLVILLTFLFLTCSVASASDSYTTVDDSPPQEVVGGMANKAARGLANLATGWLELPKQIYVTGRDDGALKGALVGPLKGLGMVLVRTACGAGELATFFLAYPGFYGPWFEPGYVWEKE